MASKRKFDLQETKGTYEIIGKTSRVESDKFFSERTNSKDGKKTEARKVNFGIIYDDNEAGTNKKEIFVGLDGYKRDKVYASKSVTENGKKKFETKDFSWENRYNLPEGFSPIGIRLGIEKQMNSEGKIENVKKNLYEYDACDELHNKLMDDQSVYVRGSIQNYTSSKGEHRQQFNISQISLLSDDIEFGEGFTPKNHFKQPICFKGIEQSPDRDGEWIIYGYVISYNSIEEIEMITRDATIARNLHKQVKPYWYIELWGDIENIPNTESVKDGDVWGKECSMDKQVAPSKTVLVVTGAKPSSIDGELYSEESIDQALAIIKQSKIADKDYGKSISDDEAGFKGNWGSVDPNSLDEEEDWE